MSFKTAGDTRSKAVEVVITVPCLLDTNGRPGTNIMVDQANLFHLLPIELGK